jgi:hypothetical protein
MGFSPTIKQDISNNHLYAVVNSYLSKGFGVVYAAEVIASSDRERTGKHHIVKEHNHNQELNYLPQKLVNYIGRNKFNNYIQQGLLTVLDPDAILPTDASSIQDLIKSMNEHIEEDKAKLPSKAKGILFVNSPENFFEANLFDRFLEFEQMLGPKLKQDFRMLCWYRKKRIQTLSFAHLIRLANSHHSSLNSKDPFRGLGNDSLLNILNKGIDKAIGQRNSSVIILETMRRRYNISKEQIIESPHLFTDVLKKISPDSAETIIEGVAIELRRKLTYNSLLEEEHHFKSRRPGENNDNNKEVHRKKQDLSDDKNNNNRGKTKGKSQDERDDQNY